MNRAEFEQRALQHLDAVHRMAMQLARNEAEAADLVQETFLRAFRAAERFEDRPGGLKAWLFRILHNTFFSEIERARRRPTPMDPAHDVAEAAPRPDDAGPSNAPALASSLGWNAAALEWEHVDARLKAAVARLRPEFREVLLLWAVEGLKYREVAEILEVPIGTVMSRLHRARALLATDLQELAEERGLDGGS